LSVEGALQSTECLVERIVKQVVEPELVADVWAVRCDSHRSLVTSDRLKSQDVGFAWIDLRFTLVGFPKGVKKVGGPGVLQASLGDQVGEGL